MTTLIVGPDGWARLGPRRFRCALGRGGVSRAKREGDGTTPSGTWRLRSILYRADRLERPCTELPVRTIEPDDGWCDDPEDPNYNRMIRLPYPGGAEALWREDRLYDLIVPLGYNDAPAVPELGSAIFLHLARPDFSATEGCVGLGEADLREVLRDAHEGSRIVILPFVSVGEGIMDEDRVVALRTGR